MVILYNGICKKSDKPGHPGSILWILLVMTLVASIHEISGTNAGNNGNYAGQVQSFQVPSCGQSFEMLRVRPGGQS